MSDYLQTRVSGVSIGDGRDFTLETLDRSEKGIKYSVPFDLPGMIPGSRIDFYHGHIIDGREKRIDHDSYVEAEFYERETDDAPVAAISGRKLKLLEEALKADTERMAQDAANEREAMGL